MPVVKKARQAFSAGTFTVYTNVEGMACGEASVFLEPFSLGRDEALWLTLPGMPEGSRAKLSVIGWRPSLGRPARLEHMDRWGGGDRSTVATCDAGEWHLEAAVTQGDPGREPLTYGMRPELSREERQEADALRRSAVLTPAALASLDGLLAEIAAFMASDRGLKLQRSAAGTAVRKAEERTVRLQGEAEASAEALRQEEALAGILDAD